MMVVMTMMEVELHLKITLSKTAWFVKCGDGNFVCGLLAGMLVFRGNEAQNCGMRFRFAILLPVFVLALAPVLFVPVLFASGTQKSDARKPAEVVDINHASMQELLRVPGMTPSWAA